MANILLIDDEVMVRQTLGLALTKAGHTVAFAGDGDEGMQKIHALQFDLVIADILMPQKEGIETIIALRKVNDTVPVIAISGKGSDFLKAAAVFGATRTLRKPFGGAALLEMVEDCLMTHPN